MGNKISKLTLNSPRGWEKIDITSEEDKRTYAIVQEKIGIIIQLIHNIVRNSEGEIIFQYDSPLFTEMQGAVSIPYFIDQSKQVHVGFVHIDRPVLNTDIDTYHDLLNQAIEKKDPQILLSEDIFGANIIEVPRGMGSKIEGKIESSIEIATKEADEEMGVKAVRNIDLLGNLWWNTTFSPTLVPVYGLEISSDIQSLNPQEFEAISGIEFISLPKVNEMIANGDILDAMSITGIKQLELFLEKNSKLTQNSFKQKVLNFLMELNPFS